MNDRVSPIVQNASGWSVSETLTAGLASKAMSTQIKFPKAGVYTLQFDIASEDPNGFPNPEATVSWKVEGNTINRLMSAGSGMSITGVGQSARIGVRDNSEAVTGFNYVVSASISPGPRASNQVPPMYFPVAPAGHPGKFVVGAASTRTIAIPQNLGLTSVQVLVANLAAPAVLTQADVAARITNILTTLKEWFPSDAGVWVPVPPSAQSLVLVNTTIASVLFSVAFGVDG